MSTSASSDPAHPIRRHAPLARAAHTAATAGYLIAKWVASPFLYVSRHVGWNGTWPSALDASCNLACLPLTEGPDERERRDVTPSLAPGDPLPEVSISLGGGERRSLRSFVGRPLLLALVRGNWCSYSRMHLTDLSAAAPRLSALGIQVLAVSRDATAEWWESRGVTIPIAADPEGAVFGALGVRVDSWMETAWGRVLPHESVFLFDESGRLVTADVRQVSGTQPRQTFLSAERWVQLAQSLATRSHDHGN